MPERKVATLLTLRWIDVPGVATAVLIGEEGRRSQNEREGIMRKIRPAPAGWDDRGRGHKQGCREPLEAGKGRETDSPL